MSSVLEFSGASELIPALRSVADKQPTSPDLVVIRDFITDPALLAELSTASVENNTRNRSLLYKAVPELYNADRFIAKQWSQVGYRKLRVSSGFILDQVRRQGLGPHVDEAVYGDRTVEAIAQGSLCLQGQRIFAAEKLPLDFRNEDGSLDLETYNEYFAFGGEFANSINPFGNEKRQPRSSAVVRMGDFALFAHHPTISLHSAIHDEGESSIARLITWRATQVS